MSLFYSPNVRIDNGLYTRTGHNPQEVPNQRQQDETLVNYPFSSAKSLGSAHINQVPRGYAWPSVFPASSSWFAKARRALAGEYLHGLYELNRPGATPNWPSGDIDTIYVHLRPTAVQGSPTVPPTQTKLGSAPLGYEYGSPFDW